MRKFVIPTHTIQASASIHIAAPPSRVAALYRDVDHWDAIFPATIAHARVTQSGENWKQIEVTHKEEGIVPNTLIDLSETEIGLQEKKKKFDASFVNRFEQAGNGGTHYVVQAYISLKGIYRLLKPFLHAYVRRRILLQVNQYVLTPMKIAAETS